MDMSIFRAYDVRGVYGRNLTDEIMEKIGLALATFMTGKNRGNDILVGADIRKSSPALLDAFIRGATKGGLNITNAGITSFGVALFSGWKLKKDVTVFITSSHNPPEWNGIKFYDKDSIGYFEEDNKEIGEIVAKGEFIQSDKVGTVEDIDMKEDYVNYISGRFSVDKPVNLVVDCGNGSTCLSAPDVFSSVKNIKDTVIFGDVDPEFPGRGADVEVKNLEKMRDKVLEISADFGAAFDGDGDRVGIVDDVGRILNSDQIAFVLAKDIFSDKKGTMIVNVECSMAIERQLGSFGINIIRIPVGHTFMMQKAKETGASLGEENAMHFVMPEYFPFDDTIVVPLKIAEILSNTGRKLSEIVDEFPIFPKKRISIDCPDDVKFDIVEKLKKKFSEQYEEVNTLDGVRVDFDNGWVLARASNTTPIIRITSEAVDEKTRDDLLDRYVKIVEDEIKHK